jgi:hypothetical protein
VNQSSVGQPPSRRKKWLRLALPVGAVAALAAGVLIAVAPSASASVRFEVENLDGSGNNIDNPTWGQAGQPYLRVGTAHYADGISQQVSGPNARFVSNRIINDGTGAFAVFSERRLSQMAWQWGQFLDHTFALRANSGPTATADNIDFSQNDPMESFTNSLGTIAMNRSAQAPGTGTSTANPRQQTNTITSYLEAQNVYGSSATRLDWLRNGPVDGDPTNNQATLMMSPTNYLPKASQRGNAATAPAADTDGRLAAHTQDRRIAGDARANENIGLTAMHTVFAREHNRIVGLLPSSLSEEDKFQIARRVVIAEEQFITYQEWLPAMGVSLPIYTGYKPNVNATISNEFATAAYRVHTQIHGDFESPVAAGQFTTAQLDQFRAESLTVNVDATGAGTISTPMAVAFFNPDILEQLGLGTMLLAEQEQQYNNDETITPQMRDELFQIPSSQNPNCLVSALLSQCYNTVSDLGAIDIQRGRDHGLGTYNQVRAAFGLPAKTSFTAITGEASDTFPSDPNLTKGNEINDPRSLDVVKAFDIDGNSIATDGTAAQNATRVVRRTPLAARLKAIYGSVDNVDPFIGVFSEPHVPGTEFGETNLAIWTHQFQALRDGDRFFFENDLGTLNNIKETYGIDFRTTLAQVIARNTDASTASQLHDNVFLVAEDDLPAAACSVNYTINRTSLFTYEATIKITNNTSTAVNGWSLRYQHAQGQDIETTAGAIFSQSGGTTNGRDVTVSSIPETAVIQPHATQTVAELTSIFDGSLNSIPVNFSLNNQRCSSNHS